MASPGRFHHMLPGEHFPVEGRRSWFETTGVLRSHGIQISMDGKTAWRDNVFVERLWRAVKYEEVYLRAYASVAEARESLARYFNFYNTSRPHQALDGMTPDLAYFNQGHLPAAA